MTNKRILITGASGYLGRNLVKMLENIGRYKLLLLDIKEVNQSIILKTQTQFEIVNLDDVTNLYKIVNNFKPDIIYHLGANINRDRTYADFKELYQTNVIGTLNLLNSLVKINYQSFIFASTSEVYAGDPHPPCKETDAIVPLSPYSVTKASAEMIVRNFSQLHGKPYSICRIFNIYGKDMPSHFFLGQLKVSIKENTHFKMTYGEQKRDFIYIDDVLECLYLAGISKNNGSAVLNICSGKGTSLVDVIKIIKQDCRVDINVVFGSIPYRDNEVFDLTGDATKSINLLGFKSKIGIYEGLKKTFNEFL